MYGPVSRCVRDPSSNAMYFQVSAILYISVAPTAPLVSRHVGSIVYAYTTSFQRNVGTPTLYISNESAVFQLVCVCVLLSVWHKRRGGEIRPSFFFSFIRFDGARSLLGRRILPGPNICM
jgi:hypothetical protein